MNLPPKKRTPLGENITLAAQQGELKVQCCSDCGHWSYPPREVCGNCLGGELQWQENSGRATVLAGIELGNSFDSYFAERLPWRIVSAQLDDGPVVYAHCHASCFASGAKVKIINIADPSGAGVFIAVALNQTVADTAALLNDAGFRSLADLQQAD